MAKLIFGTGQFRYEVIQPFGLLPHGMEFGSTSHVAIDSIGRMFVTQQGDPPILVFDKDGNYLESWGKDFLLDAHGLFITSTDDVLVVDRDGH